MRALALLALAGGLAAGAPLTLAEATARLAAVDRGVTYHRRAGRSPEGRPLPLVIVTGRPNALREQIRVLVVATQHGNEPAPLSAAVRWLESLAEDDPRFARVAVLLLPVANPDGASRGRRANSLGIDLNRDWVARTQPETRAVESTIRAWQPHLLIDWHQFHMGRAGRPADWIEWHAVGDERLDAVTRDLTARLVSFEQQSGGAVRAAHSPGAYPTTLCHRWAAERYRLVALLHEVGAPGGRPHARSLDFLIDDLTSRADGLKPKLDALRGVRGWRQPEPLAPEPRTPPAVPRPLPTPVERPVEWAAAGYGVLLLVRAKFAGLSAEIQGEPGHRRGS